MAPLKPGKRNNMVASVNNASPVKKGKPTPLKAQPQTELQPLRRSQRLQERTASPQSRIVPAPIPSPSRPPPRRLALTSKNLRRMDKVAKRRRASPSEPASSTAMEESGTILAKSNMTPTPTESTLKPKPLSITTNAFKAQALLNDILPVSMSKSPANISDLWAQLDKDDGTMSTAKSAYEDYAAIIQRATTEQDVIVRTAYRLLKEFDDRDYQAHFNQMFTALSDDLSLRVGLSIPCPDFVEGFSPGEFQPFPIEETLESKAVLTIGENYAILPHLAGEWKRPKETLVLARLQCGYYGAVLVHARNQALAYLGDVDPLGHASVCTFAINGKKMEFFAHYAAPSKDDKEKTEYHQYLLGSVLLTRSCENFKRGRRQLQNLQDFAKEQAADLRSRLANHWNSNSRVAPPN